MHDDIYQVSMSIIKNQQDSIYANHRNSAVIQNSQAGNTEQTLTVDEFRKISKSLESNRILQAESNDRIDPLKLFWLYILEDVVKISKIFENVHFAIDIPKTVFGRN